jgi:glycosyltransferase involved in cell wall biosynthesis
MKIGIVAPSPVPFCIGGAENVYWGLLNQINQHTPHQAELVKLPTPETGFRDLVAGYQRFFHLNLDHFDRVISAKYPAWMVSHPYHVCYMLHRLRGLYDTYHFTGLPKACRTRHDRVADCLSFMRFTPPSSGSVPLLFDRLEILMDDPSVPADTFALPGPFARQVVHFLDAASLAPERIEKYAAISRTVADRKDYFPPDTRVEVIYPPSNLPRFECGEQDHLFTVSRLDGPKRIQLLIEAMQHVKSGIVLNIAGTGPDEHRLKEMAAGDDRVRFLGFVRDEEIVELYAHALAVPYVPLNEDYGLVTIEAMMSGKPVLTVTDSGGPTEFVTNGETGFCVPPDPEALAAKIDEMCNNRRSCREMGETARKRVSGITWETTVSRLLEETPDKAQRPNGPAPDASSGNPGRSRTGRGRRKLTVAATFPVYPPLGGGQSRVFHLYRHLARWWDIDLVTFTGAAEPGLDREIAPGLREIRVPKTGAHESAEQKLSRALNWVPVTDAAMPRLYSLTPAYQKALKTSAARADVLVACHPYLVAALADCGAVRPLWFEAQDVEIDLKTDILGTCPTARKLLEDTRAAESRCWQTASVVYACSRTDLDRLESLYGPADALLLEVPNGVCTQEVPFTSLDDRRALKQKLGLDNVRTAVFTGSWHGPNLEAVTHLISMSETLPEMNFLVLGSSGNAFENQSLPANMAMAGVVTEQEKNLILSMADVALNPMTSGSGTNLKMLEYFAAGVPVISTPFGARGLACRPGSELHTADIASFPQAVTAFFTQPDKSVQQMVLQARWLAENTYDWAVIARNMQDRLRDQI